MELRWCHKNINASTLFLLPYTGVFEAANQKQVSSPTKTLVDRGLIGTYLADADDLVKEHWGNLYCVFNDDSNDYSVIPTFVDKYYKDDNMVVIFSIKEKVFKRFVMGNYSQLPTVIYDPEYGDLDLYMEDCALNTLALNLINKDPRILHAFDDEIGFKHKPQEYFSTFNKEKETYRDQVYDFKKIMNTIGTFDILKKITLDEE